MTMASPSPSLTIAPEPDFILQRLDLWRRQNTDATTCGWVDGNFGKPEWRKTLTSPSVLLAVTVGANPPLQRRRSLVHLVTCAIRTLYSRCMTAVSILMAVRHQQHVLILRRSSQPVGETAWGIFQP